MERPLLLICVSRARALRHLGARPGTTARDIEDLWLVDGEAVRQAVATGRTQVSLRTAALLSARGMRRIPRLGRVIVTQTLPVGMAEHDRALRAACVVLAGAVVAAGERCAVRL